MRPSRTPLLNPKDFEPLVDIFALEPRVHFMLKKTDLTVNQRLAGERYVWAMGQVRQGRDPSSMRGGDPRVASRRDARNPRLVWLRLTEVFGTKRAH